MAFGPSRFMIVRTSTDLPDPDSPTMPSVRPCREIERHAVDRLDTATRRLERRAQVADLEQWRLLVGCHRTPPVGSDVRTTTFVGGVDRRPVHTCEPGGRGGSTGAGPTDPRGRGRTVITRVRPITSVGAHPSAAATTAADAAATIHGGGRRRSPPPATHLATRPPRAHSGAGPTTRQFIEVLPWRLTGTSGHEHDLVHGPEHHADEDREGGRASRSAAGPSGQSAGAARGLAAR